MSLPDWFWDTEADGSSSPIPVPVGHLSSRSPRNDAKAVHFAMLYGGPVLGKPLPGHFVAQGSFTNTTLHTDNLLKTLHQHQPPKKKVAVSVLLGSEPMQMMLDEDQYEKLTKELKHG